jgi:hypothetical protein
MAGSRVPWTQRGKTAPALHAADVMATGTSRRKTERERQARARSVRQREGRRSRSRRAAERRAARRLREAGGAVAEAGENVVQAGRASVAAARKAVVEAGERVGRVAGEAADAARERVGEATDAARERAGDVAIEAGRTAVGIGAQIMQIPDLVREGARLGREVLETSGARAVVTVIETGTKVLSKAAEYVSELAPRRRVRHAALEMLCVEQLRWAHAGTEAYDRTVEETDDVETRMALVRFKLQTIKQAETLTELLREIGGRVPAEEKAPPTPSAPGDDGRAPRGPAAARQGIALALTVATQSAEGWRALNRIAAWGEPEKTAQAILRASESVGSEPDTQVEFLRDALLERTLRFVFD